MKTYTQDYTKITEAEELLHSATRLIDNDCVYGALERINEARTLLQEYTNDGTNLVEDDDVEEGLVKRSDAEAAIEEAKKNAVIEKKAIEYLYQLSCEAECESSLTIDRPFGLDCELHIAVKKK